VKAKAGLDAAIERAKHLIALYDLLCDQRKRDVRSDWSKRFKQFMGWSRSEKLVRVDGKGTLLILRESTGISRTHFSHDYLSEILRSAVVASVSALDRFLHDLVVENSWKLLTRKDKEVPKALAKLGLPALQTRKALEHLRKNSKSRPGSLVKAAIQKQLHDQFTFQGPNQVTAASKLLGIKDFWRKVATEMPSHPSKGGVQEKLGEIVKRRHQIVHEADLVPKTKSGKISRREITRDEAAEWTQWIEAFATSIQKVIDDDL
jgi:hypothetical protein